jgi:hypothetical protein
MKDEYVNLVLSGKKIWEIRKRNTNIRERIALGNTKTKCYVGYATLADSVEMTVAELLTYNGKHHANDFLKRYAKGRETLFRWVLKDVTVEPNPKPYTYSTGSWSKTSQNIRYGFTYFVKYYFRILFSFLILLQVYDSYLSCQCCQFVSSTEQAMQDKPNLFEEEI